MVSFRRLVSIFDSRPHSSRASIAHDTLRYILLFNPLRTKVLLSFFAIFLPHSRISSMIMSSISASSHSASDGSCENFIPTEMVDREMRIDLQWTYKMTYCLCSNHPEKTEVLRWWHHWILWTEKLVYFRQIEQSLALTIIFWCTSHIRCVLNYVHFSRICCHYIFVIVIIAAIDQFEISIGIQNVLQFFVT